LDIAGLGRHFQSTEMGSGSCSNP